MRTPDASEGTIELPLTPSSTVLIGAAPWKHVRKMAIFYVLVVVFADFACLVSVKRDRMVVLLITTGGVGGVLALLLLLVWFFGTWLPARRDLREGKYLRTRGRIAFGRTKHGYTLRLGDREMFMGHDVGGEIENRGLKWAVVDYTRHTHIVLGVWDQKGKTVFLAEGYSADPPAV